MEDYIVENFQSFDPVSFFEINCSDLSQERAESSFEEAIESLCLATTKPYNVVMWCKKVKEDNYAILNTDQTLVYWTHRENKTEKLLKAYTSARNRRIVRESIDLSSKQVNNTLTRVAAMKRKVEEEKRVEKHQLQVNGVCVGTTLKNKAEDLVRNYNSLNCKAKHVVGMSLNSIIDLSDDSSQSQKQYFSEEEWDHIKEHYRTKDRFVKIRKFKCLHPLNKKLKRLDLVATYTLARKLELENLEGPDEIVFKIYAMIVDLYRFHSEFLKFKLNDPTELDYLMKVWGGIFEVLFPDKDKVYCKWGESMSEHNEYKIDCRLVYFYKSKHIDLTNMEAARYMSTKKTNDDHLKLSIESKDILDYLIKNSASLDPKQVHVPMIQLCKNQCDVNKLYLGDDGLYCADNFFSLTLPLDPREFARQSTKWFQKLFSLREYVVKLLHLFTDVDQKTYDMHFSRDKGKEKEQPDYSSWTRGSFYPPINDDSPLYVPNNLYGDYQEKYKKV
ncbi:hypothetical protein INT47_005850 [Mucor saturninus]|uniref:Uncharacterized protein n=1 Tax=Mucor saturninus TaxID=64648 RepID=A0A8H7QE53_9FUNG|nr:hypothetical protein INT47_005850 [Mucor saturninus]